MKIRSQLRSEWTNWMRDNYYISFKNWKRKMQLDGLYWMPYGEVGMGAKGLKVAQKCATNMVAKMDPNKKETTMNYSTSGVVMNIPNEPTQESKAQARLLARLFDFYNEADRDLCKEHGLTNDDAPATPLELVERIKKGLYEICKEYENVRSYNLTDYIVWRDPKVKRDQEGYDKNRDTLNKDYEESKDTIVILGNEEGFKAFKKFQKEWIS